MERLHQRAGHGIWEFRHCFLHLPVNWVTSFWTTLKYQPASPRQPAADKTLPAQHNYFPGSLRCYKRCLCLHSHWRDGALQLSFDSQIIHTETSEEQDLIEHSKRLELPLLPLWKCVSQNTAQSPLKSPPASTGSLSRGTYSDACCSAWEGTGLGVRKQPNSFPNIPTLAVPMITVQVSLVFNTCDCCIWGIFAFHMLWLYSKSKHFLFCFDSGKSIHLADCF